MEILDASKLMSRGVSAGEKARTAQLYPAEAAAQGLLAVDLLEVEPGGSTTPVEHAEEHLLFVLSGSGEVRGGSESVAAILRADSVVHVGPRETHTIRNNGTEPLRILISTPLLVRSERALGLSPAETKSKPIAEPEQPSPTPVERPRPSRIAEKAAMPTDAVESSLPSNRADEPDAPAPDISSLMKRGSEIAAGPRADRKRLAPEPEVEAQQVEEADAEQEGEAEEEHRDLMELLVVFDGGSRGNPGQGYGSYLVQSPGRKPVIKRVEFGGNYTSGQAEYESLIACLQYIVERLRVTNREPEQVALDIKSDSDTLVNQLQGNYKVKDAGLRQRHARAVELLGEFGEWMITWHTREESAQLLEH